MRVFRFLPQKNAEICYDALLRVPELTPIMPCGAMYMMVSSESVTTSHVLSACIADLSLINLLVKFACYMVIPVH